VLVLKELVWKGERSAWRRVELSSSVVLEAVGLSLLMLLTSHDQVDIYFGTDTDLEVEEQLERHDSSHQVERGARAWCQTRRVPLT
jgi:hypothetical protein